MRAAAPGPETLFALLFTSGSTGAPKAVRMTQGRAARAVADGDVRVATTCSIARCRCTTATRSTRTSFPALRSGATIALRRKFSASAFLPDVQRYGVTYFNTVGRALNHILSTPETADDRNHSIKFVLGPETAPADVRAFRERFGVPVIEGYGSSENAIILVPDPALPKGSLGRPLDGIDVVILDPVTAEEKPRARYDEHGKLLNAGEAIGEMVSRTATSRFEGYYNNPEADAERTRNGWYWSGDLGYLDEDGVFWFAGRNADWIRVDGENFAAAPVERILARFPGADGVAVYAVPDSRTGDQVMAAIEMLARRDVRSRRVRDVPRRAARPRHQVGAALRAHRRRVAGRRDEQDRQAPAARRTVGDDRSAVLARAAHRDVRAVHRGRRRRAPRRVRGQPARQPAAVRLSPSRGSPSDAAGPRSCRRLASSTSGSGCGTRKCENATRRNNSAACALESAPLRTAGTCWNASPRSRTSDVDLDRERARERLQTRTAGSAPIGSAPIDPSRYVTR